jgi:hypothetical protein
MKKVNRVRCSQCGKFMRKLRRMVYEDVVSGYKCTCGTRFYELRSGKWIWKVPF